MSQPTQAPARPEPIVEDLDFHTRAAERAENVLIATGVAALLTFSAYGYFFATGRLDDSRFLVLLVLWLAVALTFGLAFSSGHRHRSILRRKHWSLRQPV